jgi:hypothetical protein
MVEKHESQKRRKSAGDYLLSRLEIAFKKSKTKHRPAVMKGIVQSWLATAREIDKKHDTDFFDPETERRLAGRSVEEVNASLFDFNNFMTRAMWAAVALRLDPDNPKDKTAIQAFEDAGLDPSNPFDWPELVRLYSDAYLGDHGPGRDEEWHAARYEECRSHFEQLKSKYPDENDEQICARLLRTEPYKSNYKGISSASYLAKKVTAARKPQNNYYLKHPEMPPIERAIREHAERRGYSWSDWGPPLTSGFKAFLSELSLSLSRELLEKLIQAGPKSPSTSKSPDRSDPRLQIFRDHYEEHGLSWQPESESWALEALALVDEGWSAARGPSVSA